LIVSTRRPVYPAGRRVYFEERLRGEERLLPERFFDDDLRLGTFAPARRASDNPMAIACLRLFTFLPERPLLSVPALRSCIARFTFSPAFFPYLLAMCESLLVMDML
jgi:hypothetical protein